MNKDLVLFGIDPKEITKCWPRIKDGLENALKYSDGKYSIFDIECALVSHEMQLWIASDVYSKIHAIFVTQIINYGSKKVMLFVLIQGVKFDEWKHFISDFKKFAKSHDCQTIEGYGRAGWEPKIVSMGFKKVHTVYSLPI